MARIGIDLGGTNIVAGVVDEQYQILQKADGKTDLPRPAEAIVADMAQISLQAVKKAGMTMNDIEAVGVGCPGSCNLDTGVVEYSCNLDFHELPLKDMLEKMLEKPVSIENDANAAALGETVAGAAKGAKSAICITLGTGVGGGIILDGKIYDGFNFAGAELGHMVIVENGEPCGCGRRGCWEAYASATGLIRETRKAMQKHPDSLMTELAREYGKVSGRTAFQAMYRGDSAAKEVVDTYIDHLACGLVNIINIFQPEVICLGGGICHEGETLLRPLRAYIERERYSKHSLRQTRLCIASLGNDAGIIGAAAL